MKYLSVCSGIEAATCAWHELGWTPVAFSEIDAFPSAVLKHHYPSVPNWGDMTRFKEWPDATVDVLVGGTPCQSFSVAGLRKGMDDPRGNLALTFLAIADRYRPEWVVWENVPGVLSSGGGRDFGSFLGGLVELGYSACYRVLDAQYFGVAQRRRRVFVVGHLGAWQPAAAVLLERASLRGDPAPRRESRERAAGAAVSGTLGRSHGNVRADAAWTGQLVGGGVAHAPTVSPALKARDHKGPSSDGDGDGAPLVCMAPAFSKRPGQQIATRDDGLAYAVTTGEPARVLAPAYSLRADAGRAGVAKTPSADAEGRARLRDPGFNIEVERAPTLDAGAPHTVAQAVDPYNGALSDLSPTLGVNAGVSTGRNGVLAPALTASNDPSRSPQSSEVTQQVAAVHAATMAVRRLTPAECEALQGFPRGYTAIPYRGREAADGPRYKALGNSMAVPVMRWIGRRIELVSRVLADAPTASPDETAAPSTGDASPAAKAASDTQ